MKNNNHQEVEIRPAYAWTCEECGLDMFENGVIVEFSEEEKIEFEKQYGEKFTTGNWMIAPSTVKCKKCSTSYCTRDIRM